MDDETSYTSGCLCLPCDLTHVLGFSIKSNQEILPNSTVLSKYGDYKNKNQDNDIHNSSLEASKQ